MHVISQLHTLFSACGCTALYMRYYLEQKLDAALKLHYPGDANSMQGIPTAAKACWLVSDDYVNLYSTAWKIPLVVSYKFNDGKGSTVERPKKFKQDVRMIDKYCSSHNDYTDSGYSRGQIANAGISCMHWYI